MDIDNIDNNNISLIDKEISEAPEPSHQTVASSRKRPVSTSRARKKKKKQRQVYRNNMAKNQQLVG